MAFLIVEGFRHTSNVKAYATRLLLFALISQVPYRLFLGKEGNVLFTLLIGLVILYLHDRMENRAFFWLAAGGLLGISFFCDWGVLGPLIILIMHRQPDKQTRIIYPLAIAIASIGLPAAVGFLGTGSIEQLGSALFAFLGCSASLPLLLAYDGTRGRSLKYFFYLYYPAHIALLGLGSLILGI